MPDRVARTPGPPQLGGAALPDQVGGMVQVDVVARRQRGRGLRGIARPDQLLGPPVLDLVELCADIDLCRRHRLVPHSVKRRTRFTPCWGIYTFNALLTYATADSPRSTLTSA